MSTKNTSVQPLTLRPMIWFWLTLFFHILLPLGLAVFLFWRAYQLGILHRTALTHQWLVRPPQGIEAFARLFAWRDLVAGCWPLLYVALFLVFPRHGKELIPVIAMSGPTHQLFTGYALNRLEKERKRN